ncbi:MAG: hypothetical protein Q8P52_02735 [bacterium]|nr:hypothetical protein [bacterium]
MSRGVEIHPGENGPEFDFEFPLMSWPKVGTKVVLVRNLKSPDRPQAFVWGLAYFYEKAEQEMERKENEFRRRETARRELLRRSFSILETRYNSQGGEFLGQDIVQTGTAEQFCHWYPDDTEPLVKSNRQGMCFGRVFVEHCGDHYVEVPDPRRLLRPQKMEIVAVGESLAPEPVEIKTVTTATNGQVSAEELAGLGKSQVDKFRKRYARTNAMV